MKGAKLLAVTTVAVSAAALSLFLPLWMSTLTVTGMHHLPNENDLLIQASVIDADPLVISAKVKSNSTDDTIWLTEAQIKDYNQTTVVEVQGRLRVTGSRRPLCVLESFGSEETLTLDFETALLPGKYTLWFCTTIDHVVYPFAEKQFTVPFSVHTTKTVFL